MSRSMLLIRTSPAVCGCPLCGLKSS
uniref:Uncharacterized protein n=1 Tax=Anguilla anguilla TaxID=7936 RepID=A0A0E9SNX8_ANGAN